MSTGTRKKTVYVDLSIPVEVSLASGEFCRLLLTPEEILDRIMQKVGDGVYWQRLPPPFPTRPTRRKTIKKKEDE